MNRRPGPSCLRLTAALACAAVWTAPVFAAEGGASADPPGWHLVWHDEFEKPDLDLSKWRAEDAALIKNNEAQYYSPDEVYIQEGVLVLRSRKRKMGDRPYTSGLVETIGKFSQAYGRFEVRAKVPSGQGVWPAHWLLPDDNSWPPEIDIMELLGHTPRKVYFSNHWGDPHSHKYETSQYQGPDFSKDFHTYAVEWEKDEIRWYVDGKKRHSTVKNIPDKPMRIILNTAVGGDWPKYPDETTVFPQYHEIDYVRVYIRSNIDFVEA